MLPPTGDSFLTQRVFQQDGLLVQNLRLDVFHIERRRLCQRGVLRAAFANSTLNLIEFHRQVSSSSFG